MNRNLQNRSRRNKFLITLMIGATLLALAGCQKSEPTKEVEETVPPVESTTPEVEEAVNPYGDIIKSYQAKIPYVLNPAPLKETTKQQASLDAMEMLNETNASAKDVFTLFEADMPGLSPEFADKFAAAALSALRRNSFEDYRQTEKYFSDMKNLDKFFAAAEPYGFNYYDLKLNADQVTDPEIKKILTEAKAQGYMMASSEGMVYPIVDYAEFAKYKVYYTQDFAALMEQLAYGNVEILLSDAGIKTSLDHIVARVFEAENQLKDIKEGPYQKYLAMEYIEHLRLLLFGSDNSPAYDYETLKLREEVALLYKKMASYEGTKTATYVQMHMALLEASDGKYDDATMDKIRALFTKIEADFKISEADQTAYYDWLSGK